MNLFESIKRHTLKEADTSDWQGILDNLSSVKEIYDLEDLMQTYLDGEDYGKYCDLHYECKTKSDLSDAKRELKRIATEELSITPEEREKQEELERQEAIKQGEKRKKKEVQEAEALAERIKKVINCSVEVNEWDDHAIRATNIVISDIENVPNINIIYRINGEYTRKYNTKIHKEDVIRCGSEYSLIEYIKGLQEKAKAPKETDVLHRNPEICEEFLDCLSVLGVNAKVTGMSNNTISFKTTRKLNCKLQIASNVPDKNTGTFGIRFNYDGPRLEVSNSEIYKDLEEQAISKYSTGIMDDGITHLFKFKDIMGICEIMIK